MVDSPFSVAIAFFDFILSLRPVMVKNLQHTQAVSQFLLMVEDEEGQEEQQLLLK